MIWPCDCQKMYASLLSFVNCSRGARKLNGSTLCFSDSDSRTWQSSMTARNPQCQGQAFLLLVFCKDNTSLPQPLSHTATDRCWGVDCWCPCAIVPIAFACSDLHKVYTRTHVHAHAHAHAHAHTCTCKCTRTCMRTRRSTGISITHTLTYTQTHDDTHTHTHRLTGTHEHTHNHRDTHTLSW